HGRPTPLERTELQLHGQHSVWVREVILLLGDTPLVYARTAVPITTLNGADKRLQSLGERSLGSFLFQQPNLRRTPLRASHCRSNSLWFELSRLYVFCL